LEKDALGGIASRSAAFDPVEPKPDGHEATHSGQSPFVGIRPVQGVVMGEVKDDKVDHIACI
jgi:hypothetical protein